MFIAVVGINYAFPIEPIVERNRAILAAIDEGNEELAAQRWREKIDEPSPTCSSRSKPRTRSGG
jgi:hypothetical protein